MCPLFVLNQFLAAYNALEVLKVGNAVNEDKLVKEALEVAELNLCFLALVVGELNWRSAGEHI